MFGPGVEGNGKQRCQVLDSHFGLVVLQVHFHTGEVPIDIFLPLDYIADDIEPYLEWVESIPILDMEHPASPLCILNELLIRLGSLGGEIQQINWKQESVDQYLQLLREISQGVQDIEDALP